MALSSEQLDKLQSYIEQLFAKYDADGNSVLDKEECKELLKECLVTLKYEGISSESDVNDSVLDRVYRVIDADGNLVVDKAELTSFILDTCKQGTATPL